MHLMDGWIQGCMDDRSMGVSMDPLVSKGKVRKKVKPKPSSHEIVR